MKEFSDSTGRIWNISINFGTLLAVRERLEIDLLQPEQGNPPLMTRLGTDEMLLGEVIFTLLSKQMEERKLTPEDVYESFTGEVILKSQTAFYEEMINFFQGRGRMDRARMVEKQMEMITKAVQAATDKVESFDIDKMIDGVMSGSLPGASESNSTD